jgi:hypothetical protein
LGSRRPFRTSRVASAAKRFAVWNAVNIGRQYGNLGDINQAISGLLPDGQWQREWIVKAGEGGSYQARFLHPSWGDSHSLAISSADDLADRIAEGNRYGLVVTPYITIRGRPEWLSGELTQIAECAAVSERVILNLEPGAEFWNGPTSPIWVSNNYIKPLSKLLPANAAIELAAIPRDWVFRALGGVDTMDAWLSGCKYASWECYDGVATDLRVDDSFARLSRWLGPDYQSANYRIPIVQRNRCAYWAATEYAANGLEVWHLDGDI